MSKGEKAEITIEPDWAYGKKGKPEAKYPCINYVNGGVLTSNS